MKRENLQLSEDNKKLQISNRQIAKIETMTAYLQRLSVSEELEKLNLLSNGQQELEKRGSKITRSEMFQDFRPQTINAERYANAIPNILPVDGWITRGFIDEGEEGNGHTGIDFAAAKGAEIRATAPGIVSKIENDRYFGLMITVRHDYGFETRYGHCSQILVSLRDRVNRGQTIAYVGNTGRSTAPHLHYEVLKNGKYVDPSSYIIGQNE
ncbi:Peptidase, M23/M37 family [Chitinispirillum alkaliphilum]|nr:Peptidase, M23/M37 family [Chitinispirillum alkaliphilum]